MDILRFIQGILVLAYLPVFLASFFVTPIIAVIAWAQLFYKLRGEAPFLFIALITAIALLSIGIPIGFMIGAITFTQYNHLIPILSVILALAHLNRLILAWLRPSPKLLLGLINGFGIAMGLVLWLMPDDFSFSVTRHLALPFNALMALFWLVFLDVFPFRPSEKSKENPQRKLRELIICVAIMSIFCAFVHYLALSLDISY